MSRKFLRKSASSKSGPAATERGFLSGPPEIRGGAPTFAERVISGLESHRRGGCVLHGRGTHRASVVVELRNTTVDLGDDVARERAEVEVERHQHDDIAQGRR